MSDEERRANAVAKSLAFLEALDDPIVLEAHDYAAEALARYQELLEEHGVGPVEVLSQSSSVAITMWLHRHGVR